MPERQKRWGGKKGGSPCRGKSKGRLRREGGNKKKNEKGWDKDPSYKSQVTEKQSHGKKKDVKGFVLERTVEGSAGRGHSYEGLGKTGKV